MNLIDKRKLRHARIRKRVIGTAEKPRLSFYKSLNFIYAQLIDDFKGHTLLAASTKDSSFKGLVTTGSLKNKESAKKLGEIFGKRIKEKGITSLVFDRGGFQFHGVVKEFADAVRKEGVNF
jgi:large subunit ribosomal protein L18